MAEKEIISKIKRLKEIKPREEWVSFAKSEIFNKEEIFTPVRANFSSETFLSRMIKSPFQKRFAYALASFLFLAAGLIGFVRYMFPGSESNLTAGIALQQDSDLVNNDNSDLFSVKSNIEVFKENSQSLAELAKSNPTEVPMAVEKVKAAAKDLTDAIQKDPKLAKKVALEVGNKTLLDVTGGNSIKEASDSLYKEIDKQMIKDLEGATLTDEQENTLSLAKDLFEKEDYSGALENILLINNSTEENQAEEN